MTGAPPLALVTGGLNRIGAQIAAHLARAGYRLALHGRSQGEPDRPLREALYETGTENAQFHADFSEPGDVARLCVAVSDHFGSAPTLLVNNASLFEQDDWRAADAATLSRSMQVNCLAPVALAQAVAAAAIQDARQAAVVNIVDQRVANPVPDQFAYTIAKQALWQATRTMAVAFAPHVRVNAVAPGPTLPTRDYDAGQWRRVGAMLPLADHPTPTAIADAVLYLARAEHVTGQTMFVDGGAGLKAWDRDFVYL
jgi:NAD(P)-dependent dehydrogenase (short-subunit alcohol dehydrogenase family)